MSRLAAGIYSFLHPDEVNPPTPYTESGLKQYDHLHPLEAVLRAWTEPGPRPDWHRAKKEHVRAASPLLARALDRSVDLMYQSNALTKEN